MQLLATELSSSYSFEDLLDTFLTETMMRPIKEQTLAKKSRLWFLGIRDR